MAVDAIRAEAIRALVRHAIVASEFQQWSYQGFGMLRMYLYPEGNDRPWRLNIWDRDRAVRDVSEIHNHPWHLTSYVVCGRIVNHLYLESTNEDACLYYCREIKPGEGPDGGVLPNTQPVTAVLITQTQEVSAGESYHMMKDAIHRTVADHGTVTINFRQREGPDVAKVFWPFKDGFNGWVDAKPRPATLEEFRHFRQLAFNHLLD